MKVNNYIFSNGGTCDVMIITEGSRLGYQYSNPEWGC